MTYKRLFLVFAVLIVAAVLAAPAYSQGGTLNSAKVDNAPALDGKVDDAWAKATGIDIPVSGGANNGGTTVSLKSVYTSDSVYFLAQWGDPTDSVRRAPWQKQADGSWQQLKDGPPGDDNKYYEDKFAMIWNINDSIKGFNEQGCMVTCHIGEGKSFGNKYTSNEGEIGDIWHWKRVRTGPVGQIDDQYVDSSRYDKNNSPEAGRKSDAKTRGGYSDNVSDDKNGPKFSAADQKPAPPYWLANEDKQPFDNSKYKANDEVAGIIVSAFTGDRGDIGAGSAWADGKWTLEFGRKLDTGSKTDVQYSDLSKTYYFGVATFDNAQVRHAWNSGAIGLKFDGAPSSAIQRIAATLPRSGGVPIAMIAGAIIVLAAAGWSARRFLLTK